MSGVPGKKFVKNHEQKCLTKCAGMWYNRKLRLGDAGDLLRKKRMQNFAFFSIAFIHSMRIVLILKLE